MKVYLIALLVFLSPSAQAADNGTGAVSDPQSDFCIGLLNSCEAPCNAMNNGTLAGAANERACFDRCREAADACFAENRSKPSGLNMQLPVTKKPPSKGNVPPNKLHQ